MKTAEEMKREKKNVQWSGYGELGNISQKPLQPTAEGAEEMDARTYLNEWMRQHNYRSNKLIGWSEAVDFAEEFAALHAQRLAEKMKEASQFILDIARVLGMETDGVGFDGLTLSIDDFKEAAEKMVSERLREELIKFDAWGYGSFTENKAIIDDVDEYLKSRER